ncbi:hypothetical protein P7K49_014295 [Saguinus oedipus]|uniref:Uncharacterized protein n=1 Tax=Saguinus oedipus TaxID=9490 RepID=A0ABQ9VIE1_SAGOE|nr:hypothetical protein P7K49_014295 [Saguinus oedipus]
MFSDRLTLKEHKGHQLSCRGAGCSVAGLLDGKVNPNVDSKTVISACEKNTKTMSFLAVVPDIRWQPHFKAESTLMGTRDQLCSVAGSLEGGVNPDKDSRSVTSTWEENTKTANFLSVLPDVQWQAHVKAESTVTGTRDQSQLLGRRTQSPGFLLWCRMFSDMLT